MEPTSTQAATAPETGHQEAAGGTFPVDNPADGSTVAQVPIEGPAEVAAKVARVRAAQPGWEALGSEGRAVWMGRLRDWLIDNHDRVADVMQSETGKVRPEATQEAPYCSDAINFYCDRAEEFLGDETHSPHSPLLKTKKLKVQFRPHPVVGIIGPWNFPLILTLGDAIPALVAGCAVVIKPSEFTPLTINEVVRAWKEEIGGPDVLEVVNGLGETGSALVDEADFIGFTGSERTGKAVMKRAADTLTPVSLELGGKDPMIVLADADVERAANGAAWGGLANSGQICMSVERIYVEEPVYDRFVETLVDKVSELRQGPDGTSFKADVGAMVSPAQVDIVERHVTDAVEKGARVLTGGRRRAGSGRFFEPTVLVDVDHSMACMREETFGPTLPVMKVRDADEAVRLANDTPYGLSASVWSGDKGRGEAVARQIECGACNVNDVLINYFATEITMGGWKSSGIGYRHGMYGIRKYCRAESIVISRLNPSSEVNWYPYSKGKSRLITALTRFVNARDLRRKLGLRRR